MKRKKTCPEKRRRIVVSGGHLTPSLAVIKKLQSESGWKILFIGRNRAMEGDQAASIESEIIPQIGVDFVSIQAGRLPRTTTRFSWLALVKIPFGFFQALNLLWQFRPDVILSFGGYLAVPVVLAGWLLRIPIVTHEQSVKPGLATRLIARLSRKIAVSWEESLKYFPSHKTVFTGNPIREEILKIRYSSFTMRHSPVIYITGGNQGAHAINKVVGGCLAELLEKYRIIHQCGTVGYYKDYQKLTSKLHSLAFNLQKRYRLGRWFGAHEVAQILTKADLVISRAGANTLFELAYLGKPAILIPFPFLKEQEENARALAKIGLIEVLPQNELSEKRLLETIAGMMANLDKYHQQGSQARQLVKAGAASKLIEVVRECVG